MRWWEGLDAPLLGRYRIERLIGTGGMAEVLLARDERFTGKRVAIKAPNLDNFAPSQMEELLLRFRREVDRQGSEPIVGVVAMLDAGDYTDAQGKQHPFLVMDYLSGGSLGDILGGSSGNRQRTQTLAEVLAWLRPIATTLDRLHARKYLHRDVKPDNILFNADGDPFLADFGIATTLDDIAGSGTLLSVMGAAGPGSPGYQSPESLRGDKYASSDQFSLAVSVYEALSGHLPMPATTRDGWIGALANWRPQPISEWQPQLPAAAAQVLMRALSAEPRERFASCSEFAAELARAASEPVAARPAAPAPTVPPPPAPAPVDAAPAATPAPTPTARAAPAGRSLRPMLLGIGALVALLVVLAIKFRPTPEIAPATTAPPPAAVVEDPATLAEHKLRDAVLRVRDQEFELNDVRTNASVDAIRASSEKAAPESRLKALASSKALLVKLDEFEQQDSIAAELAAAAATHGVSAGRIYVRYSASHALDAVDEASKPPYVDFKLDQLAPKKTPGQDFIDAKLRVVNSALATGNWLSNSGGEATGEGLFESDMQAFHRRVLDGGPFRYTGKLLNSSGTGRDDYHAFECKLAVEFAAPADAHPFGFLLTVLQECPEEILQTRMDFNLRKQLSNSEAVVDIHVASADCHVPAGGPCSGFKQPTEKERNLDGRIGLLTKDLLLLELRPGGKDAKPDLMVLSRE